MTLRRDLAVVSEMGLVVVAVVEDGEMVESCICLFDGGVCEVVVEARRADRRSGVGAEPASAAEGGVLFGGEGGEGAVVVAASRVERRGGSAAGVSTLRVELDVVVGAVGG